MVSVTIPEILEQVRKTRFPELDLIVAIGRGGIMPAALIARELNRDMQIIWLNFRDDEHNPQHEEPILKKEFNKNIKGKKILLVDDVTRSGKTLEKAKQLLHGNQITTLVVSGKADISLFNFKECIDWPW